MYVLKLSCEDVCICMQPVGYDIVFDEASLVIHMDKLLP